MLGGGLHVSQSATSSVQASQSPAYPHTALEYCMQCVNERQHVHVCRLLPMFGLVQCQPKWHSPLNHCNLLFQKYSRVCVCACARLRCAVCGVRYAVCGMRCVVCGMWCVVYACVCVCAFVRFRAVLADVSSANSGCTVPLTHTECFLYFRTSFFPFYGPLGPRCFPK